MINFEGYPPIFMMKLAEMAINLAEDLKSQAKYNQCIINEIKGTGSYKRRIQLACEYAYISIENGEELNKVIKDASDKYNVPFDAVRILRQPFSVKRRKHEKIERDRKIMKAYRAGLNDSEIAIKLDLHPKTVARIRRENMKALLSLL